MKPGPALFCKDASDEPTVKRVVASEEHVACHGDKAKGRRTDGRPDYTGHILEKSIFHHDVTKKGNLVVTIIPNNGAKEDGVKKRHIYEETAVGEPNEPERTLMECPADGV